MSFEELGIINDLYGFLSKEQPKWHMSLYHRWINMWNRCKDSKHKSYAFYKDIEIDERYRYFSNYVEDVMSLENFDKFRENPKEWSIDKDSKKENRGYYLDNLSIISVSENSKEMLNRCGNPFISYNTNKRVPVIGISISEPYTRIVFNYINNVTKMKFDPSTVVKCCKGKQGAHKGFKWNYLEIIKL